MVIFIPGQLSFNKYFKIDQYFCIPSKFVRKTSKNNSFTKNLNQIKYVCY